METSPKNLEEIRRRELVAPMALDLVKHGVCVGSPLDFEGAFKIIYNCIYPAKEQEETK